jgi:hypothetical protein
MYRKRIGVALAGLTLVVSGLVATAVPASAGTVHNMYECHPTSGWCYQTNPPYNPAFARACRWNYTIPYFTGGMWYTGCTPGYWRPEVH